MARFLPISGLEDTDELAENSGLRWYGHVELSEGIRYVSESSCGQST